MVIDQQAQQWGRMHTEAADAEVAARAAEAEVMAAYRRCAQGRSRGPTTEQIDVAERLRRSADAKRRSEVDFLKQYFR